ncbi:NFAT activation molecule 1 [Polymixia lowei]
MDTQGFGHRSKMFSWIFVVLILFLICPRIHSQTIKLKNRFWIALAGEDLDIDIVVVQPANQSGNALKCFNPKGVEIYRSLLSGTTDRVEVAKLTLPLTGLLKSDSGEYRCEYFSSRFYWVLLVRDESYQQPYSLADYRRLIIVGALTSVLLIFSMAGSVYIFKGHWDSASLNTERGSTGEREEQKRDESREEEEEGDNNHTITAAAPPASFYASLEPRPRSIYDVLDPSAANTEESQKKPKPNSKEFDKTMGQTTHNQDDGVFECVYENF